MINGGEMENLLSTSSKTSSNDGMSLVNDFFLKIKVFFAVTNLNLIVSRSLTSIFFGLRWITRCLIQY
jgi:hypothetical protein